MPGNDNALHLGGAFADIQQFLVAVEAFHVVFPHEAVPAVDLDGMIGAPVHHLWTV